MQEENESISLLKKKTDDIINSIVVLGKISPSTYLLISGKIEEFNPSSVELKKWDLEIQERVKSSKADGVVVVSTLITETKKFVVFVIETQHNRFEEIYLFEEGSLFLTSDLSSWISPFYFERTKEELC